LKAGLEKEGLAEPGLAEPGRAEPEPDEPDLEKPPGLGRGRSPLPALPLEVLGPLEGGPLLFLPPKDGLGFHPPPALRPDPVSPPAGPAEKGRPAALPGLLLGRGPPARGLPLLVNAAREGPPSLRKGRAAGGRPEAAARGGPDRPAAGGRLEP
jgi:hypothetical protein